MTILASNQIVVDEVVQVGELKLGDRFTDDQDGEEATCNEYTVTWKGHGKVEAALAEGGMEEWAEFDCLDLVSITRVVSK